MLRGRSRAVTSKQSLMADQNSQTSLTINYTKPASTFFSSSRFKAFTTKSFFEADGSITSTWILDSYIPSSAFRNPFSYIEKQPKSPKLFSGNKRPWEQSKAKGIAVALNDSLDVESPDRKLLFSKKLTVQIPQLPNSSHSQYPQSPSDFGINTRNSNISANGYANSGIEKQDLSPIYRGLISVSDVENSEDYTRVISRGPSPRTTHIFNNCIVESYEFCLTAKSKYNWDNFLSFCYTCRKNLDQKNNVYIYRGEKAFCSRKCRYEEMILDGLGNTEFNDVDDYEL